ncbi:hypothetical protein PG990_003584 [Apiospora arundinis]
MIWERFGGFPKEPGVEESAAAAEEDEGEGLESNGFLLSVAGVLSRDDGTAAAVAVAEADDAPAGVVEEVGSRARGGEGFSSSMLRTPPAGAA